LPTHFASVIGYTTGDEETGDGIALGTGGFTLEADMATTVSTVGGGTLSYSVSDGIVTVTKVGGASLAEYIEVIFKDVLSANESVAFEVGGTTYLAWETRTPFTTSLPT
jgi:hypothetical protein